MPERFLIIQLADIGDLILSTPALAGLRDAKPDAHIAVLTTAHAAPILPDGLVDEVITFDKHTFDSPKALLKPGNLRRALGLAATLRRGRYDTIFFFHHFTTRFGSLKFAALALSAGSRRRIGLDNGNGSFLTERLPDAGFGAKHQAEYWLNVVGAAGGDAAPRPAQIRVDEVWAGLKATPTNPLALQQALAGKASGWDDTPIVRVKIEQILAALKNPPPRPPRIAIHAGSGGYSLARRWDAAKFAQVGDALAEQYGAEIVLVGTKDDDSPAVKAAMRHAPTDMSGRTSLAELAALLKSCDLLIGADSGVLHMAAAVGTPVVAVFGPSNAAAWQPWTPDGSSSVVRSAPECSPCSYVGHGIGLRQGCAARTCMRMVTAAQVIAATQGMLKNPAGDTQPTAPSVQKPPSFEKRIRILGLPVSAVTYAEWLELIDTWVQSGVAHHVCTINPEMIMIAQKDPNFYNILSRADLTVPDGVGLLWAARRKGTPLPERVTGSDGVPLIASEAAKRGWRVFLLGAAPGVAEKAAAVLRERHPALQIAGVYSGSPAPDEEDAIVERVNASDADILFVAYGAPEQDKWIARNLPRLQVKMAMGVGGSLDFVAGVIPRAPHSFQRLGLEWLYRLYLQPKRIIRMMRLPRFALAVMVKEKHG